MSLLQGNDRARAGTVFTRPWARAGALRLRFSVANQEKRSVCDVTLISDKICSASNSGEGLGQGESLWNQPETNSSLATNVRVRGTRSVSASIATYYSTKSHFTLHPTPSLPTDSIR